MLSNYIGLFAIGYAVGSYLGYRELNKPTSYDIVEYRRKQSMKTSANK